MQLKFSLRTSKEGSRVIGSTNLLSFYLDSIICQSQPRDEPRRVDLAGAKAVGICENSGLEPVGGMYSGVVGSKCLR
jgi:hypothetical protein